MKTTHYSWNLTNHYFEPIELSLIRKHSIKAIRKGLNNGSYSGLLKATIKRKYWSCNQEFDIFGEWDYNEI